MKKYLSLTTSLGLMIWMLVMASYPRQAIAQQEINEKFENAGPIGISNLFTLPDKINAIVYRIKNNTTRTIFKIYGWVYMYDKGPNNTGKNFVLMNNPHKGGNIIKGRPHRPGTIAEWSFPLVREPFIANAEIGYSLRVHPRSVFFANVESGGNSAPNP